MKNRIKRLEQVVDSLVTINTDIPMINNPTDKIPLLAPTPQVSTLKPEKNQRRKICLSP